MSENKIIDLRKYKDWKHRNDEEYLISEFMCVSCMYRWYGFLPKRSILREVECPVCKKAGFIIMTGQLFEQNFAEKAFALLGASMDIEDGDDISVDVNNDDEGKDD